MYPQALFALLPLDGPAPLAEHRVQILDLGKLSYLDAQHHEGQPVRVSFVIDILPDVIEVETLVDAEDKVRVSRTSRAVGSRTGAVGHTDKYSHEMGDAEFMATLCEALGIDYKMGEHDTGRFTTALESR